MQLFGLTDNEAKVYTKLLQLGSTTSGPLIKALGMHRAVVYDILDMLIEKGLIAFVIKENKRYFEAYDPSRLLDYVNSKKDQIEKQKKVLEKQIPKLREMMNFAKDHQEAYIYKGRKGIKSVAEDVLKELKKGDEWLVFGARGQFITLFPNYFLNHQKRREKLGIRVKVIRTNRDVIWKKYTKLREERFLPEKYTTPSTTFIYRDKVAFIVWSPEPMAFVVKSKVVADSYRKYFEIIWKIAKI